MSSEPDKKTNFNSSRFSVHTVHDFFDMLKDSIDEFKSDDLNIRKALTACIFANHIHDWAVHDRKCSYTANTSKGDYETTHNILNDIANGTKHPQKTKGVKTGQHNGAFSSAYSREFDISYLYVIDNSNNEIRLEDILDKSTIYWNEMIN